MNSLQESDALLGVSDTLDVGWVQDSEHGDVRSEINNNNYPLSADQSFPCRLG